MSLGLTDYTAERMFNKALGVTDYTPAATHYFGLFTVNPTDAAGSGWTELADAGYARVSKTNNATTWANWTSGAKKCAVEVAWAAAEEDWTEIVGVGVWDASTSGNLIGWGALTSPKSILNTEVFAVPANGGQFTFLGDSGGTGGITDYAAGKLMDYEFGITDYTEMATCFFGLLTTNPATDGTGGVEQTGTGYARDGQTNNTTTWPGWGSGLTLTGVAIAFTASAADWTTSTGGGIWDASTSGNLWFWGDFTADKDVADGETLTVPVGAISHGIF